MTPMMNILVCIKAVPASLQVSMDDKHTLQREGVGLQWNVADEAALEAALQLKGDDGTVTVLTMGPSKLTGPLEELFGRGVDRALLLTDPCMAGADTVATAKTLAGAITAQDGFDLILCGQRAMDGETGQVPPMLAAALSLPCITAAERLWPEEGVLMLRRRLETGTATLAVRAPAVVSVCAYTYPLRLPGILSLRRARGKQVECLTAAALGLSPQACGLQGSLTKVVHLDRKFPGLRQGDKETDISRGVRELMRRCREVKP